MSVPLASPNERRRRPAGSKGDANSIRTYHTYETSGMLATTTVHTSLGSSKGVATPAVNPCFAIPFPHGELNCQITAGQAKSRNPGSLPLVRGTVVFPRVQPLF